VAQLILELMAVRCGPFKFSNDEFLLSDVSAVIEWLVVNGMYLINV